MWLFLLFLVVWIIKVCWVWRFCCWNLLLDGCCCFVFCGVFSLLVDRKYFVRLVFLGCCVYEYRVLVCCCWCWFLFVMDDVCLLLYGFLYWWWILVFFGCCWWYVLCWWWWRECYLFWCVVFLLVWLENNCCFYVIG